MKKLPVLIIILLLALTAWAAIDTEAKSLSTMGQGMASNAVGYDYSTPSEAVSYHILGLYADYGAAPAEEGNKLDGRARYNADRGYRWRYKF